jgi:cytochrome P450
MERTSPFEPPADYARLRAESPVSRVSLVDGTTAWLITGHDLGRRVLNDPRVSKNGLRPGYPGLIPDQVSLVRGQKGFLVWMDPPDHTMYRRMLAGEFTVRSVERLRPHVEHVVDELVGRMLESDRPVDLVHALSLPVPSMTICELLGVPYADRELFQKSTAATVNLRTTEEERRATVTELRSYMVSLIEDKRRTPRDDLLSRLVARFDAANGTDPDILFGMAMNLLVGGHVTTAAMISLGTLALLQHPEQLAEILADPGLLPQTVEEMLRLFSVGDPATHRIATEDFEVDGWQFRAGDGVLVANAAANHDPAAFPEPGRLDIHRDARLHLAFGGGVHQCLGQHLSRMELQIVYLTLFRRIPELRTAVPVSEIPFKYESALFGVNELPVTW